MSHHHAFDGKNMASILEPADPKFESHHWMLLLAHSISSISYTIDKLISYNNIKLKYSDHIPQQQSN